MKTEKQPYYSPWTYLYVVDEIRTLCGSYNNSIIEEYELIDEDEFIW